MAGGSQFGAVKEEFGAVREDSFGFTTVSEFVASLKSAVRNAEGLVFAEDILKIEIEGKKIENELLQDKLQVEVLEKLRLEKECGDLKELASRLREERDELRDRLKEKEDLKELVCLLREERDVLCNRLKENEDYQNKIVDLKRKNCELECQNLRAKTDVDIYQSRIHELEGKILSFWKDASVTAQTNEGKRKVIRENSVSSEAISETNANPSDGSSHRKREDRWVIIDSDDEYASHESESEMLAKRQLEKAHSGQDVAEHEPEMHEITSGMEIEKDVSVNLTTTETNTGKTEVRENVGKSESLSKTNANPSDESPHHKRGCPISPNSSMASANPPATSSRYENQKRRDWNTFCQYLQFQRPPLSLSMCSGANVLEFLRYLDQFGKTKVHNQTCPFFGLPSPPAPCPCPLRQAWGSLDALIGRLRAAYEEHSGTQKGNPFGARAVYLFLREVRDSQAKARGTVGYGKKRKRPKS